MRGQRGLSVVRVVLDVVVLQNRLQSSVLVLLTLLGSRSLGRQAIYRGQRLLSKRQVACLNDILYCVRLMIMDSCHLLWPFGLLVAF